MGDILAPMPSIELSKCVFATPRRPWRENYNEGLKSGDDIC